MRLCRDTEIAIDRIVTRTVGRRPCFLNVVHDATTSEASLQLWITGDLLASQIQILTLQLSETLGITQSATVRLDFPTRFEPRTMLEWCIPRTISSESSLEPSPLGSAFP